MTMFIKRNGGNAAMTRGEVVNVPRIKGRISGEVGGMAFEGDDGFVHRVDEIGDIVFN